MWSWCVQRLLNKDRTGNGGRADSGLYDIRRALVVEVPRVVEIPTTANFNTTALLDQPHSSTTGLLDQQLTTTTTTLLSTTTTTRLLDPIVTT